MRHVRFVAGFAAGCATVLLAAAFTAQDPPQQGAPATEEEMMQMWQEWMEKYGNPSAEHERLARRVGNWTFKSEWWDAPGGEPSSSTGTTNYTMLMDGRYLLGEMTGDMDGMPFEGASCTAYDRFQKKYVNIWLDSMSTGFMISDGKATGDNVLEFTGKSPNPATDQMATYRIVEKEVDNDTHIMEMYGPDPTSPGKEFLNMRITYTRAE